MSSSNERDWRELETMEAAASRLLRVLDERAKKRKNSAGGDTEPAKIAETSARSLVAGESGDEPERMRRSAALDGSSPTAAGAWEGSSGMGGGHAGFQGRSFSLRSGCTARPTLDEHPLTDRAITHAPED